MRINRNISAVLVNDQLLRNENSLSASVERLSSGFKLNHAKDNPSGMAISYKMQAQINALDRASANTTDGLSIVQTIDSSMGELHEITARMRELCVQAANDTNTKEDREAIQQEISSIREEINRISRDTEFNGKKLLDGSFDRRTYVTNEGKTLSYYDKISNIQISDSVQSGSYKVLVKNCGTKAGLDLKADLNSPVGVSGTIKINGAVADINSSMKKEEVLDAIRKAAEQGGVDFEIAEDTSGTTTKTKYGFVQQRAGSAYSVDISFSNDSIAGIFKDNDDTAYTVSTANEKLHAAGTDADVQISEKVPRTNENGEPIDEDGNVLTDENIDQQAYDTVPYDKFSQESLALVDGNKVVIRDKSGFEMSFDVEENVKGNTEFYYIEATDIGTLQLQVGANEDQELAVRVPVLTSKSLYLDDLDVTKIDGASRGITQMDEAIAKISAARSKMGAYENALEFAGNSLDVNSENMNMAISRLEDTDMAKEMTTYANKSVLNQAAISILSQANDMPQQVLSLLQF